MYLQLLHYNGFDKTGKRGDRENKTRGRGLKRDGKTLKERREGKSLEV